MIVNQIILVIVGSLPYDSLGSILLKYKVIVHLLSCEVADFHG